MALDGVGEYIVVNPCRGRERRVGKNGHRMKEIIFRDIIAPVNDFVVSCI